MKKLTKRNENYSKWYNEIILRANIAEKSDVRGCMIIKPYGFYIWEKIKSILDNILKYTGHENVYFPLLIPKSYFSKEYNHIKGFAKECAIISHYRLKNYKNKNIIVDKSSKLEDELIVRPTSETIIWNSYKRWINSYRDLPILFNQWANIIRWERRTRLFLRTSEFLWQEGHTAHSTKKEAINQAKKILNIYTNVLENFMAIPVIQGIKTDSEKFAGAEKTYCIESIMQDGKSLQIATSHFLGQNFSKAFDVRYSTEKGNKEYVWATSWGISTRLIGAIIMTHSDDNGLILPPKIAPIQIVIIPVYKTQEQLNLIEKLVFPLKKFLEKIGINIKYDKRIYYTPGWKFNEYEIKGIPIRITIGKKDIDRGTVEVVRRDTLEKKYISINKLKFLIPKILSKIQDNILKVALKRKNNFLIEVDSYEEFIEKIKKNSGFLFAHWDGSSETETKIKVETNATIRCIPINLKKNMGKCIFSKNLSKQRVLFAKSY
ncbi:proline--tRNA ligase [Candidatus Karelsulcia muelleri]|uniref:Proline--tRNA ligase n=1 Tax=Candidatus Karelsulcia muelleri PSPU TaxID=1189303 RepID=A0AAD1B0A7_9FLAO|nr:proline--tRNA ligase [Candidatus Karelsulcia muelleri]NJJ98644.1 proline--tRNA ligase [Candidatus Karelsulcia muelleri]BAO66302.1 prolyl-tRNA synthetase [Candidatus Karelsulcia muelleri PSPU]